MRAPISFSVLSFLVLNGFTAPFSFASNSSPPPPSSGSCEAAASSNFVPATARTMQQFLYDFATLTDEEVLNEVIRHFPEMMALTGRVDATPDRPANFAEAPSPSARLFGVQHTEFDRTYVGILVLKWILAGDRSRFDLSEASFQELRQYVSRQMHDQEALHAMIVDMVINDLGKVVAYRNQVREIVVRERGEVETSTVNHDKILYLGLQVAPQLSPSFQSLNTHYQKLILEGLRADFNMGQFFQAESLPANLRGLFGLSAAGYAFYDLHWLLDFGGVRGHVNPTRSLMLNNERYLNWKKVNHAITDVMQRPRTDASMVEAYDTYLAARGQEMGFDTQDPRQRVLTRIGAMVEARTADDGARIRAVFERLHRNVQAILVSELNATGVSGDRYGVLAYYAPQTLRNSIDALTRAQEDLAFETGLELGLNVLARAFMEARIKIADRSTNGVYTIDINDVAKEMSKNPRALSTQDIQLEPKGKDDAKAVVRTVASVDVAQFPRLRNLLELNPVLGAPHIARGQFATRSYGLIGVGGGSDGIQAAMLGLLLQERGNTVRFVISVRTEKTGSQGPTTASNETRAISNHGGEIAPGVFRVLPQSTGSGRFLENLAASRLPTFLVVDRGDGSLQSQIEAILNATEYADTLVGVDTGGDALFRQQANGAGATATSRGTPDQDYRVLSTLSRITGRRLLTAEVAVGIDSPDDAQSQLRVMGAHYYELTEMESQYIQRLYSQWGLDGSDERRYGKTALAWQRALSGAEGYEVLDLPTRVVMDRRSPWNPFVYVGHAMRGIFFSDLHRHVRALAPAVEPHRMREYLAGFPQEQVRAAVDAALRDEVTDPYRDRSFRPDEEGRGRNGLNGFASFFNLADDGMVEVTFVDGFSDYLPGPRFPATLLTAFLHRENP